MSIFKQLCTGADKLISSMRLPFIQNALQRGIQSARDNALQKLTENEISRMELLKKAIDWNTVTEETVKSLITMEVEVSDQQKIIDACNKLEEDLFWEDKI